MEAKRSRSWGLLYIVHSMLVVLPPSRPILEVAILNVLPGQERDFELALESAVPILSGMKGYLSHQVRRCLENSSRYLLLVAWETLEDHTVGFRGSAEYQEWKALLHHFYDPFPVVEHYGNPL